MSMLSAAVGAAAADSPHRAALNDPVSENIDESRTNGDKIDVNEFND